MPIMMSGSAGRPQQRRRRHSSHEESSLETCKIWLRNVLGTRSIRQSMPSHILVEMHSALSNAVQVDASFLLLVCSLQLYIVCGIAAIAALVPLDGVCPCRG